MAPLLRLCVLLVVCACATAQYGEEERPSRYIPAKETSTPVSILKQINRHNDDGSYTYGYEAGDGSFKIETKAATGEVKGKYGYKDDTGKLRVIEYGANKYGFQPSGEGITVAPPTLVDESRNEERPQKQGGSKYRQQQQEYDYDEAPQPAPRPAPRQQHYRPQPQQQEYRPQPAPQPQFQPAPQPQFQPDPQPQFRPQSAPQPQYRPEPAPQPQYRAQSAPTPPKHQFFAGAAPAPVQQDLFAPEPQQPRPRQYQPAPAPQIDQFSNFGPSPAPVPRFTSANFPEQRGQQPFSMLDQLLKEYALPKSNAAPLHDITFGSY